MKRVNSTIGMSGEIEAVVTKLLRTTKALLEALTQWSHMRASNSDIFEIHDTLERQFFLVSQAFEEFHVSMGDLQWIPRQLRDSVSICMLEPPSPAVLDQYLPRIREVIVSLLQGLKGKQALLRDRERERESRGSIRSSTNTESWNREVPLAALNRGSTASQRSMMMYPPPSSPPLPPMSSPRMNANNTDYDPWSGGMPRPSMPTNDLSSRIMPPRNNVSTSSSSSSSNSNIPYSPPQQQQQQLHSPNSPHQQIPLPTRSTSSGRNNMTITSNTTSTPITTNYPPPPPPPPPPRLDPPVTQKVVAAPRQLQQLQQQDFDESDPNTASALAALKRQENLARRSSVRRASMFRGNNTDYQGGSISSRGGLGGGLGGSKGSSYLPHQQIEIAPPVPSLPTHALPKYDQSPSNTSISSNSSRLNIVSEDVKEVPQETEEKKDKGLTLFLQIGKDFQKVNYQGEISIPAINMLFLEKFSYSLGQNDFPKIYIRDPTIGVSYELVDLEEVKDKSVLSFNINEKEEQKELLQEVANTFKKELEETRRMFVEQMDELKKQITESSNKSEENIKQVLLTQPQKTPTVTEVKEEATNEDMAVVVPTPSPSVSTAAKIPKEQYDKQLLEIETLRRDMAVLRQLEREMREGTAIVIQEMKEKAAAVKEEAKKHKSAELSKTSVARSNLEAGKKDLLEKSDKVTNRLEELQDTIDQLKLDVTQRKCRPSETIMTHCADERKALSQEIEDFGKFIADVKPRWKKTWEQELQTIVKEQQTLKDQEYLLSDMKDDLDALLEVFEQLEKIYAYQASTRPQPRQFIVTPAEEGFEGMSSVFKQVATIDVDHDRRLRALELADKMRQRELANRIDDFEKELVGFVGEKKLRKTGGALEIDRLRKEKEEAMMKEMYAAKTAADVSAIATSPTKSTSTTSAEQAVVPEEV